MEKKKAVKKGKNMDEGSKQAGKDTSKDVVKAGVDGDGAALQAPITTTAELHDFSAAVLEKLLKGEAPPIYAMAAMQHIMSLDSIHGLLDTPTKEILQEIWVKVSQSGLQLKKPPLLFGDAEA
jgi:hypothetical protein